MSARRFVVHGVVQGVGYRWFVRHEAMQLGLRGFARNRVDGTVEVVGEGEDAALHALLEGLRRGPPGAVVERVDVAPAANDDRFPEPFEIR